MFPPQIIPPFLSRRGEWCFHTATASSHTCTHKHHTPQTPRRYEPEGHGDIGARSKVCVSALPCSDINLGYLPYKERYLKHFLGRSNGVPPSKTPHTVLCIVSRGCCWHETYVHSGYCYGFFCPLEPVVDNHGKSIFCKGLSLMSCV